MRLLALLLVPAIAIATDKPAQPQNQSQHQEQNQQQAQAQGQGQEQSASSRLTNNYVDRLQIPFTPAPTAPAIHASGPCNTGNSKAVTLPIIGLSRGESTTDTECNFRELVRVTTPLSPGLALLMICSRPDVQSLPDYQKHCTPSPVETYATVEQLEELREESRKRADSVFKQSLKK